ncbi:MAG: hypothetical protein ACFFB2_08945 [Promethearchaeota archaeon]
MAWIGGVVAATAACNNGRKRKKPKLFVLITMFCLIIGIFVPLVLLLGTQGNREIMLFPLILIMIIGIIVFIAASFAESLDYDDETTTHHYRKSRPYQTESRSNHTSYRNPVAVEDYYWGSEPKSTSFFCINCGMRLESDDRFCASCGWRVN